MRWKNPTRTLAGALFDFPAQVLLIALIGGALGGAAIVALDHAPDALAWLRGIDAA